jgi:hypothetical protein
MQQIFMENRLMLAGQGRQSKGKRWSGDAPIGPPG